MGRSLSKPQLEPAGTFEHKLSGSSFRIDWQDGIMHHRLTERGLTADYPIAYSVGYGKVGHSYFIELGGHLFQSPAAYYTGRSEWDVSPGYERERVLDFTRVINSSCLACHAGAVTQKAGRTELQPITCERCHGPSQAHRLRPIPGSIVNPAKLAIRSRDSVCEQCHLEGATAILNPGKSWWDFHPGEALEQVETSFVYRSEQGDQHGITAVSQAEQLALSKCSLASGGKLWCGTCHDPHGEPTDRKEQIKKICSSCHAATQLAAFHQPGQDDCVSCHMPKRGAADVAHAAITDHRIPRRPTPFAAANKSARVLAAWHDPLPAFAKRAWGLAYFNTARAQNSVADFAKSFALLAVLPGGNDDPKVAAAMGYMLLGTGQPGAAVTSFEAATRAEPADAEYWLDLGVAQNAKGDSAAAVSSLQRSMAANAYDYRAYEALADLYEHGGEAARAEAVRQEFLRVVPQSILMRIGDTPAVRQKSP